MENKNTSLHPTEGQHLPFPSKDLALLWRIPFSTETEPDRVEFALRERIKELNCLYGISQLAERNLYSIDDLLKELVDFLPYSWQYPDITCARIFFKGKTYTSDKYKMTN
ncbi:LuxR family transcriptional regulator, partial [Chloroflexota bacterium]